MSLKLVEKVNKSFSDLSNLTAKDWKYIKESANIDAEVCSGKGLLNFYTGVYDYTVPNWLKSEFIAANWDLNLNGSRFSINWGEVNLNDGAKLTDNKHIKLLNAFKYWVIATDDPYENGGKVSEQSTVYNNVNRVIQLINVILLNGDAINLAEQHLKYLTEDFFIAVLVNYASGGGSREGIYELSSRTKALLEEKILLVSDEKASSFKDKYPSIERKILDQEKLLNLSITDRVKACCWLHSIGFYGPNKDKPNKKQGHISILVEQLYSGKIITRPKFTTSIFEELKLQESINKNEYRAVPNKDVSLDSISKPQLSRMISCVKLLSTVNNKPNTSAFPIDSIKLINVTRIMQHVSMKKEGRFLTVPPNIVFALINKSYEFIFEKQDSILASILSVSHQVTLKNRELFSKIGSPSSTILKKERRAWVDSNALTYVDKDLLKNMNIQYVDAIKPSSPNRHLMIRNNESLIELYNVLIGSIQTLTGALVARRQGELIELKSSGNLTPNIDPSSIEGESSQFHIIFQLKKSGVGGENSQKAVLKRPLPRSLALIIWKLEAFNQKVLNLKIDSGTLALFNSLHSTQFIFSKALHGQYNQHLDAMCDYFETPLVEYGDGELRRYYLRQHQLRRFFAMIFYWSKRYSGADSLRWMLGHTDLEHLHNYITESEPGAMLKGIKASYILYDMKETKKLENIDKLQAIIAKKYGVKSPSKVMFATSSTVARDYEDTEDYQTIPHISQLEEEGRIESLLLELLEDQTITLEPTFFSVMEGNQKLNDFTLSLSVNELY